MVPKNEKYFKPQGHNQLDGYIYEIVVTLCFPLQINSSSHKIIWWIYLFSSENCGEESTQVKLFVSAKKTEKIVWSSRGREENNKMKILLWKETLKI